MELKENIKMYRKKSKMTLDDVAKHLNVARATVQRYESGVIKGVPSDKIEMMAELFGVSAPTLMGWDENEDHKQIIEMILKHAADVDGDLIAELLQKFNKLSAEDRSLALQLIGKMDRSGIR